MAAKRVRTLAALRDRGNPLAGALGRKLLGWFLLFSLVPLFGSNALGYARSEEIIARLVERYLRAISEVEAQHIGSEVLRQQLDLRAIAAGNEFLRSAVVGLGGGSAGRMAGVANRGAVVDYLSRKTQELEAFDMLALLDRKGRVLVTSDEGTGHAQSMGDPTEVVALLEPVSGRPAVGPRLRVVVPVSTDEGVVGYLGGMVGRRGLNRFLEIPEHLGGTVESYIVDRHGYLIYGAGGPGELDYADPLGTPVLQADPGGFRRYQDRRGVEVIATSAAVPSSSWRYVAEVPVQEVLGSLQDLRRLSLYLGWFFTALLMVTAWFVAGGIVAPVRRLVAATRRVGRGDLDVRVDVEERDEIGELGTAFNEMAAELSRASARVEELHRREIERAQQLATVGELASGVAHEIKNPLVGVSNGLDLVLRRVGEDDELSPIMTEMQHQLARIEAAIRDLLAFARPATPTLKPVDGNRVVARAVRLVQPAAERDGVSLEMHLDEEIPEIQADEELIRQGLVNLLMNAVHASTPGGRVEITSARHGDDVEFQVRDNGRGITPVDLEHIFKPFYTTRHSGTGLGLSITREIVERHGGRIDVETRVGLGSTFTMVLPAGPAGREGGEL
ncbi:MAG: ATP-binding protein [Gemmatimonadota bacterium]|jgi:signal transduction histidine kinase